MTTQPTDRESGPTPTRNTTLEARAALVHELDYRRQRRESIFTWANTVLLAITGGVIGLQLQSGRSLAPGQQALLIGAVLVLAIYSCLWWEKQRHVGGLLRAEIAKVDARLGIFIPADKGLVPRQVGGLATIILLALVAVVAIVLPIQ